jgi:glycerophosphoryl diester phosphodiesterase
MIEEVHGEGLKVVPWTANEEPEIDRLIELGVDGIISDYPEKVVAVLAKRAGR